MGFSLSPETLAAGPSGAENACSAVLPSVGPHPAVLGLLLVLYQGSGHCSVGSNLGGPVQGSTFLPYEGKSLPRTPAPAASPGPALDWAEAPGSLGAAAPPWPPVGPFRGSSRRTLPCTLAVPGSLGLASLLAASGWWCRSVSSARGRERTEGSQCHRSA